MRCGHWLEEELLERRGTSPEEIRELFALVDRDLTVAAGEDMVPDWQFIVAYQAALGLATVVLRATGYRTLGGAHHLITFDALGEIAGPEQAPLVRYLQGARAKRNAAEYRRAGQIDAAQAKELLSTTRRFRGWAIGWLQAHHPVLVPPGIGT